MATVTDVENALVGQIAGALYPTPNAPSVLGYPVKIYAGWPDSATLDRDMVEVAGNPKAAHVSVYPLPALRNTTRYLGQKPVVGTPNPTTFTLSSSGYTVTVGGSAPATAYVQNLAVFVSGKPYLAQSTGTETAAQMAARLLTAIQADWPGASLSGSVITLPAPARIGTLRVGSEASVTTEVRRQERQFQISTWSSNPTSREAIHGTFDPVLAGQSFITLADGTDARLLFHGEREDDFQQTRRVYRRSSIWLVEYQTALVTTATEIVAMEVERSVTDAAGDTLAGPVNTYV